MTRHRFMSNTEQRVLHASAKNGQEIRLTYANQTTEVIEQFAIHYDQVLGSQYAFDLPDQVFIGWEGGKTLVGSNQKWKYKTEPVITSQRGLFATLQVTLIAASTTDLAAPSSNQSGFSSKQSPTPRSTRATCNYNRNFEFNLPAHPGPRRVIVTYRNGALRIDKKRCEDGNIYGNQIEATEFDPQTVSYNYSADEAISLQLDVKQRIITQLPCGQTGQDIYPAYKFKSISNGFETEVVRR